MFLLGDGDGDGGERGREIRRRELAVAGMACVVFELSEVAALCAFGCKLALCGNQILGCTARCLVAKRNFTSRGPKPRGLSKGSFYFQVSFLCTREQIVITVV